MADAETEAEPVRSPRQRELIDVAAKLFAERGYHAVGINEISSELGLTGPAFYRHFASKEDLLIAVFNDLIPKHVAELRAVIAGIDDPLTRINAIIDYHVSFTFEQSANLTTWRTEFRSIPEYDRHRMRSRMHQYVDIWVSALLEVRPELTEERARVVCQGAIALIQSPTEYTSKLSRTELAPILSEMGRKLLIPAAPPVRRTAPRAAKRATTPVAPAAGPTVRRARPQAPGRG